MPGGNMSPSPGRRNPCAIDLVQLTIIRVSATVLSIAKPGARMFICICNGFTDRQITGAVRDGTAQSVSDVYRCMGCKPQCGRCAPTVLRVMRETTRATETLIPNAVEAVSPAARDKADAAAVHAPAMPPCNATEVRFAEAAE
jgi:bacterioferritin-associated ferredoxin